MAKAESLGWYALSLADRLAILKAAGFKRELVRTCLKPLEVQAPPPYSYKKMVKSHLRNRRGYLYLCWRDKGTVRNFYLGKAPRKSPTAAAAIGAGAGELARSQRRAKKAGK
jgi:hypothetical protein